MLTIPVMSYQLTIKYLYGLQKYGIKFGLSSISRLLKSFSDPQDSLKVIHIAGTNGKGSTGAILSSILMRAGFKVGFYTSPHLVNFTERIKINEQEISEAKVTELTELIKNKLDNWGDNCNITFFEFVTAMAILYFAEQKVDFAVIEVGMGGRLDATNVVNSTLSIITNISKEHEAFLGTTIGEIAMEKAGIIKKKGALITSAAQPEVLAMFQKICLANNTDFYQVGKNFQAKAVCGQNFDYHGQEVTYHNLKLNLLGKHQITNAMLSLGAIEILKKKGAKIDDEAVYQGLAKVSWPGRLESVQQNPRVILDGAHNPLAANILRDALRDEIDYQRLFLILGIMEDKNIETIISSLAPLAHEIIFTKPDYYRSASPKLLYEQAGNYQCISRVIESIDESIRYSLSAADEKDLICITGSLFTVGEAKKFFQSMDGKQ